LAARLLRVKKAGRFRSTRMADVTVTDNTEKSRFEVNLEGHTAFAEYHLKPGQIVLPHTVVPPAFEGMGVASALARHAFGYAREKGLKVVPTCPFMAGWVKKHPEAQDIVDDSCRAELGI
jgi:predicted GNAT family acetyltransferase